MVLALEAVIKKDCFIVVCVFTSTIHVHVYSGTYCTYSFLLVSKALDMN